MIPVYPKLKKLLVQKYFIIKLNKKIILKMYCLNFVIFDPLENDKTENCCMVVFWRLTKKLLVPYQQNKNIKKEEFSALRLWSFLFHKMILQKARSIPFDQS